MDDLSARLSEILNDPESMKQVRLMAEGLLGAEEKAEPAATALPLIPDGLDIDIPKVMSVLSHLNKTTSDPKIALLTALKPNLSEDRQKKVDTAIKLLKMIELLPLLKDSGILNL